MNGLQRTAESFRYTILSVELWISPNGIIRRWLRKNIFVGVVLLIPALFVLPVVKLILWECTSWLPMFSGIAARLIFVLILFITFRMSKR